MSIKAKNIVVVGRNNLPTLPKEEKQIESFSDIRKNIKPKKVEVDSPSSPKYVEKQDGELIRHINTKSFYLKDMVDFET